MQNLIQLFQNDLKLAIERVYIPCGFELTNPKLNKESKEYAACSFHLKGQKIEFRIAKITPKKSGQFVTIWKRNEEGITTPFNVSDELDFIIISVRSGEQLGQFIFPKSVLAEIGILSGNGKVGKRGIRVYPPWDFAKNKQALQTQAWQIQHFLSLKNSDGIELERAKRLFEISKT